MELKPSEIDHVEDIGTLDGNPVKMLRTVGGFYIALGTPKGKGRQEALAAGSHPAIVKYNVEKQHRGFEPVLAKNEAAQSEYVIGLSELLSQELRDKGYEMYSLQKNQNIEYTLTHHGSQVHSFFAQLTPDSVRFEKSEKPLPASLKDFSLATSEAALRLAASRKKMYLEYKDSKFPVTKLLKRTK